MEQIVSKLASQTYNYEKFNKAQQKAVMHVDPRSILIDLTLNTRDDYDLEPLILFVRENGIDHVDPIVVYRIEGDAHHKYGLVRGFRRLLSTLAIINDENNPIDIKTIPALIEPKPSVEQCLFQNLYSNNGKPLSAMETAKAYKRLIDFQWTVADIAKDLGKSEGHVYQMLTLADAPKALQGLINDDRINPTLARQIIEQYGADNAAKLLVEIANGLDHLKQMEIEDSKELEVENSKPANDLTQLTLFPELEPPKKPKGLNITKQNPSKVVIMEGKKNKKGQTKITGKILKSRGLLKGSHDSIIENLEAIEIERHSLNSNIHDVCFIIRTYESLKSNPVELYNTLEEYYKLSSVSSEVETL